MFNAHRIRQYEIYNGARTLLINEPEILLNLEKFATEKVESLLRENLNFIRADYDEASWLYPFWQQYPPDERGRLPRGDQFPWIEVGEHVIGDKLTRLLEADFSIRDVGIPTGPDKRYILTTSKIKEMTKGLTDSFWLFVDITNPRTQIVYSSPAA